jgi:hypothetical protein
MTSKAATVDQYIAELPADRKQAITELRKIIKKKLPKGFQECMGYGMPGYVVPHSKYPPGYHCNPKDPLPFMGFASQKNFIAVYHMGMYSDQKLEKWFIDAYTKLTGKKADKGKSCLRYKKPEDIPYKLIGELAAKITPDEWIATYETAFKNSRKKK